MELVISIHGSSLSVKDGKFMVKTAQEQRGLAVHKVSSVTLHRATRITYEAIVTAIENNIDVLFVDRKGHPVGRIWSNRFGSISTIRKNQLAFSADEKNSVQWIKEIIIYKIENQRLLISLSALSSTENNEKAIALATHQLNRIITKITKIKSEKKEAFASLRGLEGHASAIFFRTISALLPEQYHFPERSRMPALDMFNCLLNYTYGILYGKIETCLLQAGLDPSIGFFHRDEYNKPVLVYDFIEKYRHWAEYNVIQLCMQQAVFIEFFDVDNGGFCLNEEGKKLMISTFNDYLNEVVEIRNLSRSRLTHLLYDAQAFASFLKKYNT